MLQLKKPPRLHRGDKVATVSLSWGAALQDRITLRVLAELCLTARARGILCQAGKRSGLKNAKGCKEWIRTNGIQFLISTAKN